MKTFTKSKKIALFSALIIAIIGVSFVSADNDDDRFGGRSRGGMMGDNDRGGRTIGRGMMGGGMMGGGMMGGGMMGSGFYGFPKGERIELSDVQESIETFMEYNRLDDLELGEVMEFDFNYYAQLKERKSGKGALEILIDPYTGYVREEQGPNMMWNTKYGHMSGWANMNQEALRVGEEEAVNFAQAYLDTLGFGLEADDHADEFYGYYTIHVLEDNGIVGMLSVNGFDGSVWYHSWHGDFISMDGDDHR